MADDEGRRQVIARWARKRSNGYVTFCGPSRFEQETGRRLEGAGTDGKVIYPDRLSAESAARELEALGSHPMRAYECRRSRRGHHHLTRDNGRAS
jgi:hypothetical protein